LKAAALPPEYQRALSPEELNQLPIGRYPGEVWVVDTPAQRAEMQADLGQETLVGFDTETRPAFRVGEHYPPSLVQIATARRVYLLPLQRLDFADQLSILLRNPASAKAGVAMAYDLRELQALFPFEPAGIVDLGLVAKRHGLRQTGLRNLAGLFLGLRIPKGNKTTNWSLPRLSEAQIRYAATDAWVGRELYLCFQELGLLA
jgi:ribonuclease D